jgi:histone H3/H4
MEKSNYKINSLIKRRNLALFMKSKGIDRINPIALNLLEKEIESVIEKMAKVLKERMLINGRKTLRKEDMENLELLNIN